MERISCCVRHSVYKNILSAGSHDIHLYSTNSSDNKIVPSQVSPIDLTAAENNMSMGPSKKKRFINKKIYHKSSFGSYVPSETYPPPSPIPHPETSRIYLTPLPPCKGRHLWMGPYSIFPICQVKSTQKFLHA